MSADYRLIPRKICLLMFGLCKFKKAVTLVELVTAASLLGLLILAATSLHLFACRQLRETDIKAYLLNRISLAMEHMVKNMIQGIGDRNNPGIIKHGTQQWIKVRLDRNLNGWPDDNGPGDWIAYKYIRDRNQIQYHRNYPFDGWLTTDGEVTDGEVIVHKVTNVTFTLNNDDISLLGINITTRQDPTREQDPITNPQISLQSRIQLRSTSMH